MARALSGNSGFLSILAGASSGISEEDARILRGLRAGIEAAYEELLDKYEQAVYGLVYRLVGTQTDACDVVQEVFLKVFRGVHNFREQSSLRTWIYRIAINEVHNQRRWWVRHCRREVSIDNEDADRGRPLDFAQDPGRSPYDQALDSETRRLIENALTRIKPVFRTAVVLRDVQNLSYEEMADILQVSLGTVKSRIVRGREALRAQLTQRPEQRLAEAVAS
jgi:RNA polymerase sigma-70 factor (ECF subfamily)